MYVCIYWGHRIRLEDMICTMAQSSAFLGERETISILQSLMNFFDQIQICILLISIYEKIWHFSESKTIDVHCSGSGVSLPSSQTCSFGKYARKIKKII